MKFLVQADAVLADLFAGPLLADPLTLPQYLQTLKLVKGDLHVAYGASPSQWADLYLPRGPGTHPVVIMIHGGCWSARIPAANASAMAADLAANGMAVWNIEYRRVGEPGGGYPGMYQDVATAINRLREVGPAHQLDLDRVMAVGHSSGAHLALWAASQAKIPANSVLYQPHPLRIRSHPARSVCRYLALRVTADRHQNGMANGELRRQFPALPGVAMATTSAAAGRLRYPRDSGRCRSF